ncbi:MAG: TetR/AcrR family transcriptional regulator [Actinobacteria bacterium]|nr:TetR/AcrR family transcriptional regulator [Cyanobacteriota bacterium]MCL5770793.1 TetR/AcrR family transcriptional regulator [Actinomycetota bacterium]
MTQYERKIAAINKILNSAENYIKKNGINSLDINEICKEAGLTKGAFYHHFKNKQHLLLELLNRWINKVSSQVEIPISGDFNTTELIFYIIEKMSPSFEQAESQLPIFLELYIKAISDKNLKKYVLKSYNSFLDFFSDLLKEGMSKGYIKKENPTQVAKILFSITLGLLIQGLIDPSGENWNELAKKSVRMLLS